jgi:hypothetical protein
MIMVLLCSATEFLFDVSQRFGRSENTEGNISFSGGTLGTLFAPQLALQPAHGNFRVQRVRTVAIGALEYATTIAPWWNSNHRWLIANAAIFDRILAHAANFDVAEPESLGCSDGACTFGKFREYRFRRICGGS